MPAKSNPLCFLDSNLWLYAMLPQNDQRKELIRKNRANIVISTQVINEITNNLLRKGNFSEQSIRMAIRSLYHNYQVVTD